MEHDGDLALLNYGSDPAVLVFADSIAARVRAETAVRAAGGRVAAALPLSEALGRLDTQAGLDGLMIELDEDAGPALDGLLDRVDALARDGRCASVIAMPVALIDLVAARAIHKDIQLLCTPDPLERAAALGVIFAERRARLHDVTSETETRRLHELSEEVGRIARALASLSANVLERSGSNGVGDRTSGYRAEPGNAPPLTAEAIRGIIRLRRLRDRFFEVELFADPAWDMLLDLMAARAEGGQVAVSSLCIAAAVPPTTALRWIRTMTENGLFVRHADPADGRRIFIELSDEAAAAMGNYFAAMRQIGGIAV